VLRPDYDFATHTRLDEWQILAPRELVLLEGTLVLADAPLRELLDIRVYVDAPRATRLARRLTRDVAERGRDVSSCLEQHWHSVWPTHDVYALSAGVLCGLADRIDKSASRSKSAA
jgi:uridine kinase